MKNLFLALLISSQSLFSIDQKVETLAAKIDLMSIFHDSFLAQDDDHQNLKLLLDALENKDFDNFKACTLKGLTFQGKNHKLYQYYHSLLLSLEGDINSAKTILNETKPVSFFEIDFARKVTENFVEKIEQQTPHSSTLKLGNFAKQRELSDSEKKDIMNLLWGTGKIIGGIFIFVTGHPGAGIGMMTNGAIEIGKEILKILATNYQITTD